MFSFFRKMAERKRWLNQLRNQNRAIAAAALLSAHDSGTLIVNRTTADFSKANCWWTPDDILTIAPCEMPDDKERRELQSSDSEVHDFDLWCFQRYLSTESGSAMLILPVYNGARMASILKTRKPNMKLVLSWSAFVSSANGGSAA